MSRVLLIAADKPLPLFETEQPWSRVMTLSPRFRNPELRGQQRVVSGVDQFTVYEHTYYRSAVADLELEMRPHQYEFHVADSQWGVDQLTAYLKENLSPGEKAELWSLWVGSGPARPVRYAGSLADFDLDTLRQFFAAEAICITITI